MVRWLLLPLPLLPLLMLVLLLLEHDVVEEPEVERLAEGSMAVMDGDRMRSFNSRKEKRAAVAGEAGEPVALASCFTT